MSQTVRPQGKLVLIFAPNVVILCHLLGAVAHAEVCGELSNRRWNGCQVSQADAAECFEFPRDRALPVELNQL